MTHVKVIGAAACLPQQVVSSREVMQRMQANSRNIHMPGQMLEMLSGIKTRRYIDDDTNASDLAVGAARRVLEQTNTPLEDVDLVIFASASQDVSEPATAHIVQRKLGIAVAAMDVKNACNSFINGVQVAEALLLSGQYKTALVCVGETPSRFIRWHLDGRDQLLTYMAGYTFGDAGAAFLLQASDTSGGIFYRKFESIPEYWDIGGVFAGGSMHTRNLDYAYFTGSANGLREVFQVVNPDLMEQALAATGLTYADFSRILVHQVTMSFLDTFIQKTKMPREKIVITLPEYGNMVAASMPVAFALAVDAGEIKRGDKVLFAGIAGGLSLGVLMLEY